MKLKVILNKDIAFSGFVRNVVHLGIYEWIRKWQKGPLKKVSMQLAKKASIIFNFYFTYERNPIKDINNWLERSKAILFDLEKFHNKQWKLFKNEIKILGKNMNELIEKYGDFILKIIPEKTKIPWKYKETWIIPSIYYGSTTEDNKIFVGVCRPIRELAIEKRIPGLVHELIHVNEQEKFLSRFSKEELIKYVLEEKSKFKFPNLTREITTMIISNSVIEAIEKRFNLRLEKQSSHPHYKNLIKVLGKDFIKKCEGNGFEQTRKFLDDLIYKKNLERRIKF